MAATRLNADDYREHVREFRQYGYDPYNSHFETHVPGDCCLDVWFWVRSAIDMGEINGPR